MKLPQRYRQCDPRWAGDLYGSSAKHPTTICAKGCALSSLAMALTQAGSAVDPSTLDFVMQVNGAFDGNGVNWDRTVELESRLAGKPLRWNAHRAVVDKDYLRKSLCAGHPVIVGVNRVSVEVTDHLWGTEFTAVGPYPGHFVLFTGVEGDDFTIADPAGRAGLLSQ